MCKDASLTFLNELGYNVIRYPRSDILPLDVLGRQRGTIARLGRLADLVVQGAQALPAVRSGVRAPNLEARRSSKLDADAAVTVLGPYLKALGGNPGASAYFHRLKSLQFVFTDVLLDEAAPAEIGAFLGRSPIDDRNLLWRSYLTGEGELFIITETLKSQKLTVSTELDTQAGIAFDTGALQSAIGGKVGVSASGQKSSLISFDGSEPLIFGFKCLRLQVAGGNLALLCAAPSAALAFTVPGADASDESEPSQFPPEPALLGEGLLNVRPPKRRSRQTEDDEASQSVAEASAAEPLQLLTDSAPLPEEDSPASAAAEDGALIYVRLFDAALTARGGMECRIRGPLGPRSIGPAPAEADVAVDERLCSDEEGVLLLDGCPTGAYEISCDAATFQVHTLRQRDLITDSEPYRLIVAPAP